MARKIEAIKLDKLSLELENAKNLIMVYSDFIDNECPASNEDYEQAQIGALCYARRTEMFRSTLSSAVDILIQACKTLDSIADNIT